MAYFTSNNNIFTVTETPEGIEVVIRTGNVSKVIQMYLGGILADWQKADPDMATFNLSGSAEVAQAYFLAVDEADADVDFFADAFPTAAASGNRIQVWQVRSVALGLHDRWLVYLDDVKETEQFLFPGGREAVGFGDFFGHVFGIGAKYAPGFGITPFGLDDWGIGPGNMEYITEPLPSATYSIKTSFVDGVGNESTKSSDNETIATYARPASVLSIDGYVKGTNTLTISFTESPEF